MTMVLPISDDEYIRIKAVLMDEDAAEALRLLKTFRKRLEEQMSRGLKPHLDHH